ncbi:MAG: UDP-N-acetylmuramoyl-L-alanine--D-glutamate ligase [Zetaproteobacteria bacterium]|nr:MAG: UDP-N-acetylmuramoyl-L-alanine--D-glutamate ligase [Zetaproteobacteria bacterium]
MTARSYRGMRVAVLGAGRTGASLARFFMQRGAEVVVFAEQEPMGWPQDLANVPVVVGRLDPERLARFARVAASPGIPWTHPALVALRARGVRIIGDWELFVRNWRGVIAAVTGTNGKSTVVTLAGRMAETLPHGAAVGGNLGTPLLDLLAQPAKYAVVEVSSFQLERSRAMRVPVAVLTSFAPDHLEAHGGLAAYRKAKKKLFLRQRAGDVAILPDDPHWQRLGRALAARGVRVLWIGREIRADDGQVFWQGMDGGAKSAGPVRVVGAHARRNVAIAAQIAALLGVAESVIREGVTSFLGLPHRLQALGECAGHSWFDDSKATNPQAAQAALEAFERVIWICGGDTKGVPLEALVPVVRRRVAHAVIIGRDPSPFVALCAQAGVPHTVARTIEEAVAIAARLAPGIPVVLSPAAASLDQFSSYAERGERFAAAVRALEASRAA